MRYKLGLIGISLGLLAIFWLLVAFDAHIYNNYTEMRLAPYMASFLKIVNEGDRLSGHALRESSVFDISEQKAIYLLWGYAFLLGAIAVFLSFMAVKRREHNGVAFGSFAFGNAPIIIFNIEVSLITLIVSGTCLLIYKKRLRKLSSGAQE